MKRGEIFEKLRQGKHIKYEMDLNGNIRYEIGRRKICIYTIIELLRRKKIKVTEDSSMNKGKYVINEEGEKKDGTN